MASQYKLTYFDLTGLGEIARYLLHYGGINFVDNRVSKSQWPALKSSTPLGQLPILEVDGQVLFQSLAIARFLASRVGLTGETDLENWEIDAVVDTVSDLKAKIVAWYFETDGTVKETLKQSLEDEALPFFLGKLDEWAKKNEGYLALGKLTWADLFFVTVVDYTVYLYGQDYLTGYPNLLTVRKNVTSVPRIKAWIDKRPKDDWFD